MNSGIYVALRVRWAAKWRNLRDVGGYPITSTWIDEAGEGETKDLGELWARVLSEVTSCTGIVVYAEPGDFPLKGALVEAGIALGAARTIIVCLPDVKLEERSCRPIGSWINHPAVVRNDFVISALMQASRGQR